MYASWQAGWQAERRAIVTSEGEVTFGELHQRVRRATGWLHHQGIGPGQTVALAMRKCPAFLELNLAALRLGAVTLPINDRYTPREVAHPLRNAPASFSLLPDRIASDFPGAVPESAVRGALDGSEPYDPPTPPLSAPAVLLYTSGTTGAPKGVLATAANLAATVEALHTAWQWSSEDVLLHALPLYHVHGLLVATYGALRAGATSIWVDPFDAVDVLGRLAAGPATVFMGVPTFYARMIAADGDYDLRRMRLVTSGSAGLPATVHQTFESRFGPRIVERYGMTEIGIATSNPVDGERRPGSIGQPLPGVEVRIVDEAGQDVATGDVGELRVRSPAVVAGYHQLPDATAAAFVDGFLKTGDLGYTDPDGYLHLVGRRSELVIVGGLNVYPAEIEAVLATCPGVREAAVGGVPDPDLGEIPVAAVVGDVDVDAVLARLRQELAPYKIPRRIHVVDALPRNAMGKVVKRGLFAELAERSR